MRGILEADSLPEMEWYSRATAILVDHIVFDVADKAGVPLEVENRWSDERAQEQVANQMMRNYVFVGEMVFSGVTDPELVGKMYYEGFANPVDMGEGLTLWDNVAGFAERNSGPWDDWEDNYASKEFETLIDDINSYNMTNFALTTVNMRLYGNLTRRTTDIYNRWLGTDRYGQANRYLWTDYSNYFDRVYRNLR